MYKYVRNWPFSHLIADGAKTATGKRWLAKKL